MSNFKCSKCGIVRRDSPRGYFSGCVHLPAEVLRQDIEDMLRERQQEFHNLEQKHGCTMRIYGSMATGTADENSDVDVLVAFGQPSTTFSAYFDLMRDMEVLFGREIDLVEEHLLVSMLRPRILQEARTIEQLLDGNIPPARKKSPLLYLSGIERAAKKLKTGGSRHGQQVEKSLVRFEMERLARSSRRLVEVFPGFADAPWKSIRTVVRINRRLEDDPFSITHRDLAEARKCARKICKRLRLDPDSVLAEVCQ